MFVCVSVHEYECGRVYVSVCVCVCVCECVNECVCCRLCAFAINASIMRSCDYGCVGILVCLLV